jgi:hypothetical protein
MYIVADKGFISGILPTRFTVSRSPIRNVVSLCDRYSVLPDLFTEHVASKNPCLTSVAVGKYSPRKNKPQLGRLNTFQSGKTFTHYIRKKRL